MTDREQPDSDDSQTVYNPAEAPAGPTHAGDGTPTAATRPGASLENKGGPSPADPPRIPGYRSVRKLGEGAFGAVWLYVEERTGVQVAVKFFPRGAGQEWLLLQAEVKQLALLHADPGIVQLRDVEPEAKPPYYVMTYAPGGSLADRLHQGRLFGPAEALKVFREAAEALAYVHAKGVRHCDLKPGNILLDARGRALVADFGQAHLVGDDAPALGTFFYMAPEQADLGPVIPDTRWDVYGLGAVVYALLTGRPPFDVAAVRDDLADAEGLAARLKCYRECVRLAPRPAAHRALKEMDRDLAAVIDRCLEVDPDKRFRDAGAVLDALRLRERRRRRRPMLLFGLAAPVLLLLAMALGGGFLFQLAVTDSEAALTNQVLEHNRLMAQVMARLVDARLQRRSDLLAGRAADPALAREVRQGASRPQLHAWLARFQAEDKDHYFFKWTLADPDGHIIADEPQEPDLWDHGQKWAWRDWFSGGGNKYHREAESFPPHAGVRVSQPYVAAGVDEKGEPEPIILTISAPVPDPDDPTRTVGLLAGSLHVRDLYEWLLGAGFSEEHGFPVLVNDRLHCLAHRDYDQMIRRIRPRDDANPEPLDSDLLQDLVAGRREAGTDDHYLDSLDGGTYLAGYAPAEHSRWVVVVQQEREAALEPVRRLKGRLVGYGLVALASAGALTSGLWAWLIWTLRREETAAG